MGILDEDFNYLWINKEAHKQVLDLSEEEIVGKSLFEITEDSLCSFEELIILIKEDKEIIFRITHKDGTIRCFETYGLRYQNKDDQDRIFIISKDITEKRTQKANKI